MEREMKTVKIPKYERPNRPVEKHEEQSKPTAEERMTAVRVAQENKRDLSAWEDNIKNLIRDNNEDELEIICRLLPSKLIMTELMTRFQYNENRLEQLEGVLSTVHSERRGILD